MPDLPPEEEHLELLRGMSDFVGEHLRFLADPEKCWQPSDYLPDLTAEDWRDQLEAFRGPAIDLSDELLVVLVGDMVTEEALPNYAVSLNLLAEDEEGDRDEPWPKWLRGWTAEENRHGDLLNAYLRFTGRVDMRAIEVTVHHLINSGFNPKAYPDPYNALVYTSFQERATKVSHGNVGRAAQRTGDVALARICSRIAGDESRHEAFYTRMMKRVFELDPEGAILAFRNMMRGIISMPGRFMYDGQDRDLFDHFAVVAQRERVYTIYDYADIIRHLVEVWEVERWPVSGKAARAQTYLCQQAERYASRAEEMMALLDQQPPTPFSWIHGRKV